MSVTSSSAIVGVFRDRANAEQALDALHNVGITNEQVRYSSSETSSGFFDDLKSLFTGQNATGSVANDLSDLGLSNEEASYYANEHRNGNIILAVKAPGRGAEVQNILHQYGSLNTRPEETNSLQDTTYTTNEYVATNSNTPTPITQPIAQDTEMNTLYQSHVQPSSPEHELDNPEQQPTETNSNDEVQYAEQPGTTTNDTVQHDIQPFTEQDTQPITHDNVTEASPTQQAYDSQEASPLVSDGSLPQDTSATSSSNDETLTSDNTEQQPLLDQTQDIQPATTEYAMTDPHATSDAMIESETASDSTIEPQTTYDNYSAESEAAHLPDIQTAPPVATMTDYTSEPNEVQRPDTEMTAENVPTEPLANPTPTDTPLTNSDLVDKPLTDSVSSDQSLTAPITAQQSAAETSDELQSLQAQIASLQQKLQAAKAELQSAKEREEQVRTAREREQQLQSLRQQLQALQAELEATHSELQDTHSRLGQY